MKEQLFTTEDLSRMLQVSKSTIKRWAKDGKLHCFRTPGGHRKFNQASIQEFISRYNYDVTNQLTTFSTNTSEF